MRPKNRTGIEWIDGSMNKEKSVGLDGSETQKGELFSDLPFLIMKLRNYLHGTPFRPTAEQWYIWQGVFEHQKQKRTSNLHHP